MNWNLDNLTAAPLKPQSPETNVHPFERNGGSQMNRDTIVQHVKTRDQVIVWTASDFDRYWIYRPGTDCVDSISIRGPVQAAIKDIAERLRGGIWVRGLAGIAALFPVIFREFPRYHCRHCDDFHNSDDTAEWMLLAKLDRAMVQFDFDQLDMRLTHPKRFNPTSSGTDASQPQSNQRSADQ
jgi:hypothetical protein